MNRNANAHGATYAFDRLGLALWALLLAIVCVLVGLNPDTSSVVPVYRAASRAFIERSSPYTPETLSGFLYLPAFAVAYIPFASLGAHAGDVLWRVVGFVLLTYAGWRQLDGMATGNRMRVFSIACFLALPLTAAAVRNGQATILLLAAVWLMFQSAARGRRAEAAAWAAVSVIAKPTALVAVLLVGAVYPATIGFLAAALVVVLSLPFAFAPWPYVTGLYRDFAALMTGMQGAPVSAMRSTEFGSILLAAGIVLPPMALNVIRAVAGIATLAGALALRRRIAPPAGVLAIVVLTVFYMSVFNPRQEVNTYALVALPFALSVSLQLERVPRSVAAWAAAALLLALGMTGAVFELVKDAVHWLYPLSTTVAFVMIMVRATELGARRAAERAQPRRGGIE